MLTLPTQQPTQQELAALKAAAEALPLSPWSADGDAVYGEDGDGVCVCYHNIGHMPRAVSAQARARFIGQAGPAQVLALLALIDAQKKKIADYEDAALDRKFEAP